MRLLKACFLRMAIRAQGLHIVKQQRSTIVNRVSMVNMPRFLEVENVSACFTSSTSSIENHQANQRSIDKPSQLARFIGSHNCFHAIARSIIPKNLSHSFSMRFANRITNQSSTVKRFKSIHHMSSFILRRMRNHMDILIAIKPNALNLNALFSWSSVRPFRRIAFMWPRSVRSIVIPCMTFRTLFVWHSAPPCELAY